MKHAGNFPSEKRARAYADYINKVSGTWRVAVRAVVVPKTTYDVFIDYGDKNDVL